MTSFGVGLKSEAWNYSCLERTFFLCVYIYLKLSYVVGNIFLPRDPAKAAKLQKTMEDIVKGETNIASKMYHLRI